ncbi:glycine cleavage system protein T [Sandarakinorhabdus cyanobacteriorum]|uniref:aminomethyltransferase n=1 Tax=Sandarakinorhabdus cyanobacteriorum TaxID=1981098 RepID=A0A255YXL7_9SPHN|nr:glycine cleavage system aminomethyltransferase GcvT [Sandarakinorhabdus cyanobacteriorum]OYQ33977.1 glycine cleavage system protein T [Sandarakinorhabdus cyanobacteriorum]
MADDADLKPLPLDGLHRRLGARIVPFAGYAMPIQYEGIIAEHNWTREQAGLFDVSHMGQLLVEGEGAADWLESLAPGDFKALQPHRVRYSLLLADNGGVLDDLMVTNTGRSLYLVVNGATKHDDIAHMQARLPAGISLHHMTDHALLALQGPAAVAVMSRFTLTPETANQPAFADLKFMAGARYQWNGVLIGVTRSGYTGEDGYEISVPSTHAEALAEALLAHAEVKPIGLGARDSLRLEAGLPLYGHDLTPEITPVEADLSFAISKRRKTEGGFPGAARILDQLFNGAPRKRVGLAIEGRMPAREGATVWNGDTQVGIVTSGGFAPSLSVPIAMAYVETPLAGDGTALEIDVRGRRIAARVVPMPFRQKNYVREGKQG